MSEEASKSKDTAIDDEPAGISSSLCWAITILCIIGAALSMETVRLKVLTDHGAQVTESYCNINKAINCDVVNASDYSQFLGLPLGSYGLFFYLVLLLLTVCTFRPPLISAKSYVRVGSFLSAISIAMSLGLFLVSHFEIGALCILCLGIYLVNILLFVCFAWAGERVSILKKVERGFAELMSFILALLGLKSGTSAAALRLIRMSVVGFIGLFVLSAFIPKMFVVAYAAKLQDAQKNQDRLVQQVVEDWRKSAEDDLSVNSEGALQADNIVGDLNWPVRIVEYFDYECPACRRLNAMFSELKKEFPQQIAVVYRHFPLDQNCNESMPQQMHPNSCLLAEIARCSDEQGRFETVHEFIFGLGKEELGLEPDQLLSLIDESVTAMGVDAESLRECYESGRQKEKIQKDIQSAERLEIYATPTIWINERRLHRVSGSILRTLIEQLSESKT